MASRTSLRSLFDGLSAGRRRSSELAKDRMARPEPGPTPDRTTLNGGIHPSMRPVVTFR